MWKNVRALREQLGAAQAKEHITESSALRKVAQSLSESLAQSQEKTLAMQRELAATRKDSEEKLSESRKREHAMEDTAASLKAERERLLRNEQQLLQRIQTVNVVNERRIRSKRELQEMQEEFELLVKSESERNGNRSKNVRLNNRGKSLQNESATLRQTGNVVAFIKESYVEEMVNHLLFIYKDDDGLMAELPVEGDICASFAECDGVISGELVSERLFFESIVIELAEKDKIELVGSVLRKADSRRSGVVLYVPVLLCNIKATNAVGSTEEMDDPMDLDILLSIQSRRNISQDFVCVGQKILMSKRFDYAFCTGTLPLIQSNGLLDSEYFAAQNFDDGILRPVLLDFSVMSSTPPELALLKCFNNQFINIELNGLERAFEDYERTSSAPSRIMWCPRPGRRYAACLRRRSTCCSATSRAKPAPSSRRSTGRRRRSRRTTTSAMCSSCTFPSPTSTRTTRSCCARAPYTKEKRCVFLVEIPFDIIGEMALQTRLVEARREVMVASYFLFATVIVCICKGPTVRNCDMSKMIAGIMQLPLPPDIENAGAGKEVLWEILVEVYAQKMETSCWRATLNLQRTDLLLTDAMVADKLCLLWIAVKLSLKIRTEQTGDSLLDTILKTLTLGEDIITI